MSKTKSLVIFLSMAIALFLVFTTVVNAIVDTQQPMNQNQNQELNQNQEQNQEQEQNNEEDEADEEDGEDETEEVLPEGGKGREFGQTNAQQHRSVVANFVQGLVHVADRDPGGIGEQVRVIAQQQNQSASTTIQAMEKVQTRNKIRIFLFSSDYKNLGALRSEMVQTGNRLEQLSRLMVNIENEEDMIELQSQIQEMEQEQERIENFIREQEGKFSLFGWFFKLIYGYRNLEG